MNTSCRDLRDQLAELQARYEALAAAAREYCAGVDNPTTTSYGERGRLYVTLRDLTESGR